jgi:hypothetical protein
MGVIEANHRRTEILRRLWRRVLNRHARIRAEQLGIAAGMQDVAVAGQCPEPLAGRRSGKLHLGKERDRRLAAEGGKCCVPPVVWAPPEVLVAKPDVLQRHTFWSNPHVLHGQNLTLEAPSCPGGGRRDFPHRFGPVVSEHSILYWEAGISRADDILLSGRMRMVIEVVKH